MPECGIFDDRRSAQLILRDRYQQTDLITIDVLSADTPRGPQGITLAEDMEGLWKIPTETPLEQWAYQDGATPSDRPRKLERRPKATFVVYASTFAELVDIETLLWSVLSVDYDCWLRIYFPEPFGWRELRVRLLNEPNDQTKTIHGKRGAVSYPCNLLACDPFWYAEDYQFEFTRDAVDARPHMTPVSGGYEIEVPWFNETDQNGWAEWNSGNLTATAETWTFPDGDSGNSIELPDLAGAGKTFWLQTNPSMPQLRVREDGSGPWARMRAKTFTRPLFANTPTPRTVTVRLEGGVATSSMLLTIPRRYDRPIGGQLPIVAQAMSLA